MTLTYHQDSVAHPPVFNLETIGYGGAKCWQIRCVNGSRDIATGPADTTQVIYTGGAFALSFSRVCIHLLLSQDLRFFSFFFFFFSLAVYVPSQRIMCIAVLGYYAIVSISEAFLDQNFSLICLLEKCIRTNETGNVLSKRKNMQTGD